MKKLLIFSLIFIMISFIIYLSFNKLDEINFDFNENIFVRVKREKRNVIEQIPLEEYVVGVVSGEMPVTFHEEALKAQSVAARSYVLKKIEQNINGEYDVVDTIANQVYLDNEILKNNWKNNYVNNINKIRKAVFETRGEYLTYDGEIITAFFFSTSVGKTENSEDIFTSALPYLKSVDSKWDEEVSPVFKTNYNYKIDYICNKLNIKCKKKLDINIMDRTSTGRIKKLKINDKEFTGQEVAKSLNLRSSYFDINQDNDNVYITTKGYGHGVGMSQYGAYGMALKGYKYDQILKYYYKDIEIKKI